jgi:formate hydrogenlyase transcriptional activator
MLTTQDVPANITGAKGLHSSRGAGYLIDRHETCDKWRSHARPQPLRFESTISGIVSGEFDRILEANDAFLELVGHTREDFLTGRLRWPALTPPEFLPHDERAPEEGLQFGACSPCEIELTRKDGACIPVLIVAVVLKLSPFRWITFVQDRERDRMESVDEVIKVRHAFEEIIGSSTAMMRVMGQAEMVAPTDATVLILGETGKRAFWL